MAHPSVVEDFGQRARHPQLPGAERVLVIRDARERQLVTDVETQRGLRRGRDPTVAVTPAPSSGSSNSTPVSRYVVLPASTTTRSAPPRPPAVSVWLHACLAVGSRLPHDSTTARRSGTTGTTVTPGWSGSFPGLSSATAGPERSTTPRRSRSGATRTTGGPSGSGPVRSLGPAKSIAMRQGRPCAARCGADMIGHRPPFRRRVVRAVDPGDVHTRLHELGRHARHRGPRPTAMSP